MMRKIKDKLSTIALCNPFKQPLKIKKEQDVLCQRCSDFYLRYLVCIVTLADL